MKHLLLSVFAVLLVASVSQQLRAQDHKHDEMQKRGNAGMGFAQDKTTHHFLLTKNGGIIQVTANSANDQESVDEIQMHLQHIRHAFESGDFNIPMFVHDQTPPGVPTMTRLKDQLHYRFDEMKNGGRVVISSNNQEAVNALHAFLRFQIKEHQTGDPLQPK